MTIRRYIFIGIPAASIITIIVSLIISQPKKEEIKDQKASLVTKESTPSLKQPTDLKTPGTVTQSVQGLSIPNYDEQGNETLVMRGENTYLLGNNVYKIISPEIEVLNPKNTEAGTVSVFITSKNGEMNTVSNEGHLSDDVVVQFDQETQLNTDYLRYLPDKKFVYSDNPITINGKGLNIKGQGCEIDLVNKKMWITRDTEMMLDGISNDLFTLPRDSASSPSQTPEDDTSNTNGTTIGKTKTEKTIIRSSGQLIFDRQPETDIMTFHDNVEVKNGISTIFSDKLTLFLDPKTKKTKQAIASGNVLASQGTKIAKGSILTWDVTLQTATIEDPHKAEFVMDSLNIDALKMIFFKETGKIEVPSAGSLKTRLKEKSDKKPLSATPNTPAINTINIKWEGKMNLTNDMKEAIFEQDVEVRNENSTLLCNTLDVTFADRNFTLATMKASEKVHVLNKKQGLFKEAIGDQMTWNAKNKVTVLRGKPFAMLQEGKERQILAPRILFYEDGKTILCEGRGTLYERGEGNSDKKEAGETDIKVNWAKKMVYNDISKKASFFEEVQAYRGGQKLNGDQIDAYLNDKQRISKIIATGNVYFLSKTLNDSEGLGSMLIWDLVQNAALLIGNPKAELRREGARTFSDQVYFDIAGNKVTWEGRPHWQLDTSKK